MTETMLESFFESYRSKAWPYRYQGQIFVPVIAGGIPTNPKVAEAWIKSKLDTKDDVIREMVAEVMVERGIKLGEDDLDREAVIERVAALKSLNGFKKDTKGLYIEGRQLKAALKEAVSVAVNSERIRLKNWGSTRKWLTKWFPEHVFVEETKLHLMHAPWGHAVTEDEMEELKQAGDDTTGLKVIPKGHEVGERVAKNRLHHIQEHSGINERFITNQRSQRAIQHEEYVRHAYINFTIVSDHDWEDEDWAQLWLTGEYQGLGAARSAGFGEYRVTDWKTVKYPKKKVS